MFFLPHERLMHGNELCVGAHILIVHVYCIENVNILHLLVIMLRKNLKTYNYKIQLQVVNDIHITTYNGCWGWHELMTF